MPGPTERSPLLGAAASPSYAKPAGLKAPDASAPALPLWFSWAVGLSVAVSLAWLLLIVGARPSTHKPWKPSQPATQPHDATGSFYLYAGVFNSLVGSFLSASGYCCQKVAHNRVQRYPELGAASQQRVFVAGLLVLAVGTISAVANLGILGQAVQAPFAALTLIYSALLGRFVLGEPLLSVDLLSSVLIVAGVAGDVIAAQLADLPPPRAYDLKSLGALIFRDSMMPTLYTITALAYITMILRRVHTHKLHRGAVGLLAFSSCAGVMAGFTSLATKSAVVVASSAFSKHVGDDSQQHRSFHHIVTTLLNPIYVLILLAIPAALVPQLYFLNKGLEHFGTLKFVPLYQAFIILGNMGCGMVFYNEMAGYGAVPLACFVAGIGVTLSGVCLLLAKVDRDVNNGLVLPLSAAATSEAVGALTPTFPTEFSFENMEFATEDVTPLHDFEECKRAIVKLMRSAESSIYYSTFLCDFNQELEGDPKKSYQADKEVATIASLLKAAVKRGVDVHVLYNPATDYGTTTTEEVRQLLLSSDTSSRDGQIHLAYAESDLGPSWFTQWISNNSKYAFHHQKYLCVDGHTIMVTGCDVNSERAGWLQMNGIGYYWHELGVVAPCTPAMFNWIKRNHKPSSPKNRRGAPENDSRSPPFPLVAGGWREENAMVNLILHARESVQLENQILISGGGLQHNRICAALVARIARAHQNCESFRALVLTNAAQQDEPSVVTRLYCALSIQWSLEQLEACASSTYGITKRELDQYLFVGRLESKPQASDRGILIKVHSNILIVDGWHAVRTSSNLSDRSLSARPTDTELGLMFAGPSVIAFQQQLLNMYMGTTDKSYSVLSVIDHVRQSSHLRDECCIVELTKKSPWSSVLTWFLMNAFIYCSEGATGGRYDVSYTTTAVIAENATPTPKHVMHTVSQTSTAASDENSVAIAC